MNTTRLLVAGACALFLAACTKTESANPTGTTPTGSTPAVAAQTDAQVVLELGQDICSGCVGTVRGALGKVEGIGQIAIQPGQKDFTVHYDSKKIQPAGIVALLQAAGEKNAKVKA